MKPATILTIGHSNHPIEKLLSLLQASGAEVVVDTRSQPYSKYTVQFNREALQSAIAGGGKPLAVTMNEPAVPTIIVVAFALVIAGPSLTLSVKF